MNAAVTADQALAALNWRYAVKKFAPAKKIAAGDWQALEQSLVLSPSSYGLQPWKFFVITDPDVRAQLRPASWNQAQITDASHLVVIAIRKGIGEADVDRHLDRTATVHNVPRENFAKLRKMLVSHVGRGPELMEPWAALQAYIALGFFMNTAAMLGIDTCPLEGFEPAKYDAILGLNEKGYGSCVVVAAGYRAGDDKYAALPKVRFATEDVVERIGP